MSDFKVNGQVPQQIFSIHACQPKSKLNIYDTIYISTAQPYPNCFRRFFHKVLLGWKWEDLSNIKPAEWQWDTLCQYIDANGTSLFLIEYKELLFQHRELRIALKKQYPEHASQIRLWEVLQGLGK